MTLPDMPIPREHCSLCGRSYPADESGCVCREMVSLSDDAIEAILDKVAEHIKDAAIHSAVASKLSNYLRGVDRCPVRARSLAAAMTEAPELFACRAYGLARELPAVIEAAAEQSARRREPASGPEDEADSQLAVNACEREHRP